MPVKLIRMLSISGRRKGCNRGAAGEGEKAEPPLQSRAATNRET